MELVLTLVIAGAVLLALETVLPGMVAGALGGLCLVAGVLIGYVKFDLATANLVLLGVLAGLLAGTALWLKYFPDSRMARQFVSQSTSGSLGTDRPELLHQTGTALTTLRPSGTALIGGVRVDVVTEGALLPKDTPVRVVAVEGLRIVVRAI